MDTLKRRLAVVVAALLVARANGGKIVLRPSKDGSEQRWIVFFPHTLYHMLAYL